VVYHIDDPSRKRIREHGVEFGFINPEEAVKREEAEEETAKEALQATPPTTEARDANIVTQDYIAREIKG
jgi:hypothetical protein